MAQDGWRQMIHKFFFLSLPELQSYRQSSFSSEGINLYSHKWYSLFALEIESEAVYLLKYKLL